MQADRRLFFALWPDAEQRRGLAAAVAAVLPAGPGGHPVPRENLHVTLAFLADVAETRLAALRQLAQAVAGAHPARVRVRLDRLEHWAGPRLLCATAASQEAALDALAAALRRAAFESGTSPDLNPFRAHVTLMREILAAAPLPLGQPQSWSFESFALVESRRGRGGRSIYSIVDSWTLCGR